MPQIDISTFGYQIFWLFVTFAVLYFFMAKRGLPKVAEVLEEREERITSDLDQAAKLREEGVELEAAYEKTLADAKASASQSIKEVRETMKSSLEDRRAKADADIAKRISAAEDAVAKAKADAMVELESIAVEACQAIVGKVAGVEVDAAAAKKAVKAQLTAQSGKDA